VEHDEEERMTITPRCTEFKHESPISLSRSGSLVRNPIAGYVSYVRCIRYSRSPFFRNVGFNGGFNVGFIDAWWQRLLFHALAVGSMKRGKHGTAQCLALSLVIFLFSSLSLSIPAMAQKPVVQDSKKTSANTPGKSDKSDKNADPDALQRSTRLGIQVPADSGLQTSQATVSSTPLSTPLSMPKTPSMSLNDIIQKPGAAHNKPESTLTDVVGEGRVTVYTASGPVTFGVTLLVNGEKGSQRISLQQPDGKMWDGRGDHLAPGGLQALEFLETQHARGLGQLLGSPKREATLTDIGIKDKNQIVTVREKDSDSTQYFLDIATSRLARFDFVRGQSRDSLGRVIPSVQSYIFADFRLADGVATAFLVEHYVNGAKQEELQLNKVRYGTAAIGVPVAATGR
jgi:hypothetical protein